MQKYNYDISQSIERIKKISNWYQFLAIKALVDYSKEVGTNMDAILQIESPYATRLMGYALLLDMGVDSTLISQVALIKSKSAYTKLLEDFTNVRATVKYGDGRWSKAFGELISEAANSCSPIARLQGVDVKTK